MSYKDFVLNNKSVVIVVFVVLFAGVGVVLFVSGDADEVEQTHTVEVEVSNVTEYEEMEVIVDGMAGGNTVEFDYTGDGSGVIVGSDGEPVELEDGSYTVYVYESMEQTLSGEFVDRVVDTDDETTERGGETKKQAVKQFTVDGDDMTVEVELPDVTVLGRGDWNALNSDTQVVYMDLQTAFDEVEEGEQIIVSPGVQYDRVTVTTDNIRIQAHDSEEDYYIAEWDIRGDNVDIQGALSSRNR